MPRIKKATALAVLVIVIIGAFLAGNVLTRYSFEDRYSEKAPVPRSQVMTAAPQPGGQTIKDVESTTSQERMVIYNGYVSIETADIGGSIEKIRSLVERNGGYVSGTSRSTTGSQATATMTVRVPQDKFRTSMQEIEAYGKVLDERTTSDDVTERYIDLKARLKNLQIEEQHLSALLARANTVDEILKIENELGRIRGAIDSLQGQINYIERNVAMSIITVNLREPQPSFSLPTLDWGETFGTAFRGLFIVMRGFIILVISLLPLAIVIGIPAYYFYRRKRVKTQAKNE